MPFCRAPFLMNAPSTLRRFLTASRIRNLVSPLSFKRGENYLAQRRVSSVIENNEALTATVQGTELYVIRLVAKAGDSLFVGSGAHRLKSSRSSSS